MSEVDPDTGAELEPDDPSEAAATALAEAAAARRAQALVSRRAADSFVHLDVISCYSLYASPSTPDDYAQALSAQQSRLSERRSGRDSGGRDATRRNGRPAAGREDGGAGAGTTDPTDEPASPIRAIALADYGLHSTVKMARACRAAGVEHLAGLRVRVVPARAYRTWRERAGELILLAADDEGWLNLVALNNLGHISGWHDGAPRLDWHDLARHTAGLVCLTGGPGASVLAPALERTGDPLGQGDAIRLAEKLAGLFPNRLYVELAYHGHASEKLVNRGLIQVAERLDLPTVATNAVRMARPGLSMAHRVFRTMGRRRRAAGLGDGPGGWGWSRDGGARSLGDMPSAVLDSAREQAYLKSGAEMARLFGERPGDVLATQEIAQRCTFRIPLADGLPPEKRYGPQRFFPVGTASADGARTALVDVATAGLAYRYPLAKRIEPPEAVRAALQDELRLVCEAGLAELLLAAHQVAAFCEERRIPIAARGSATSSLVAWSLGLVEVLPTDHGLSSETFVFEGRPDRPDLDLEVASAYESAVKGFLQAVGRREGRPQPAFDEDGLPFVRALRLGTCVSFGSRLAVRQAGQALGLNEIKTNILARQVPVRSAPGAIEDVFAQPYASSGFGGADVAAHAEPWTTVLEVAGKIEALPQRFGVHPSGFAFSFDYAEPAPIKFEGSAGSDGSDGSDGGESGPPPTPGALRWLPAHWVGTDSYQSGRGATLQRHVAVVAAEEGD
ncbi:MAG TPA: PHP domain-containing protein, partial [Chloroflexota bacterium]|nr:PHP domain-containing protein [Chloroflexota bacterium]